jgi:hypothetical protein
MIHYMLLKDNDDNNIYKQGKITLSAAKEERQDIDEPPVSSFVLHGVFTDYPFKRTFLGT